MISPISSKIETVLNSSNHFVIPENQREYQWGRAESLEFIEDLKDSMEEGSPALFLGTLIFDVSKANERKIIVIDGQQRLTTLSLLLIACRNLAIRLNARELAQLIQQKICFVNPTNAQSLGNRLVASESIRDVFDYISSYDWDGNFVARIGTRGVKRQVNRIKPIYDFFYSEIETYNQQQLGSFLESVYAINIVRIDIENGEEAFSIFERTNARGLDLAASDLLKNYLFQSRVEGLGDIWRQIDENSDNNILRMLKYFYVSKKGYVSKSVLYKKIKTYCNEIGASVLTDELFLFSKYFAAIRDADESGLIDFFNSVGCSAIAGDRDKIGRINLALQALRLFKILQIYPLIYAAISCFVRSGAGDDRSKSKKLVGFFEMLEKYHFINNAICERVGNEVEMPYAQLCIEYSSSEDFDLVTGRLLSTLKGKLASEEEFITNFGEVAYTPESIPLIAYIFDRISNVNLSPGQRVLIFDPDPRVRRRLNNIEHFYPQTPEGGVKVNPQTMEVVDNIGNLLAMHLRTNSRLSNLQPWQKIEKLNSEFAAEIQQYTYIRDFINKYAGVARTWDRQAISDRAKDLARDSYRRIWKLP